MQSSPRPRSSMSGSPRRAGQDRKVRAAIAAIRCGRRFRTGCPLLRCPAVMSPETGYIACRDEGRRAVLLADFKSAGWRTCPPHGSGRTRLPRGHCDGHNLARSRSTRRRNTPPRHREHLASGLFTVPGTGSTHNWAVDPGLVCRVRAGQWRCQVLEEEYVRAPVLRGKASGAALEVKLSMSVPPQWLRNY
jgi:hypothetical protein